MKTGLSVDTFAALYSVRPDLQAYDCDKAIKIMAKMGASRFAPHLTEFFRPIAEEVRTNG